MYFLSVPSFWRSVRWLSTVMSPEMSEGAGAAPDGLAAAVVATVAEGAPAGGAATRVLVGGAGATAEVVAAFVAAADVAGAAAPDFELLLQPVAVSTPARPR